MFRYCAICGYYLLTTAGTAIPPQPAALRLPLVRIAIAVGIVSAGFLAGFDYEAARICIRGELHLLGFLPHCLEYGMEPIRWRFDPHFELTDALLGITAALATYALPWVIRRLVRAYSQRVSAKGG
jgi:hypothetical protein